MFCKAEWIAGRPVIDAASISRMQNTHAPQWERERERRERERDSAERERCSAEERAREREELVGKEWDVETDTNLSVWIESSCITEERGLLSLNLCTVGQISRGERRCRQGGEQSECVWAFGICVSNAFANRGKLFVFSNKDWKMLDVSEKTYLSVKHIKS